MLRRGKMTGAWHFGPKYDGSADRILKSLGCQFGKSTITKKFVTRWKKNHWKLYIQYTALTRFQPFSAGFSISTSLVAERPVLPSALVCLHFRNVLQKILKGLERCHPKASISACSSGRSYMSL
jgi:hypothetical protein